MSSFWDLVKFEYKKILQKRSIIITLLLGICFTAFTCVASLIGYEYIEGVPYQSKYESLKKDREAERSLAGREINRDLLSEVIEAYSRIPITGGRYTDTYDYQQYARKYNEIYSIMRRIYNLRDIEDLALVSEEDLEDFYLVRQRLVEKNIDSTTMSSEEKAGSINLSRKVKTPFIYSYTGGYYRFFSQMYLTALIICFICSICIAPIFAGEHTENMDSLILSSKYGKNKIISAKLFTGLSFTVILSIILTIVSFITVMAFFGWDGSSAPIQLYVPLSIAPLTMGQVALLYSILILFANILSSTLTMFISAKLKSPFLVMVIMTVITVLPGFMNASKDILWIYHLSNLIPVKMFELNNIVDLFSIKLIGLTLKPYELIISFSIVATIILMPLVYRSFKNHN